MFLPWFIGLSVCLSVSKISHVQKNTKFKEIFERDDLRTKNIPLDFCDDESDHHLVIGHCWLCISDVRS